MTGITNFPHLRRDKQAKSQYRQMKTLWRGNDGNRNIDPSIVRLPVAMTRADSGHLVFPIFEAIIW